MWLMLLDTLLSGEERRGWLLPTSSLQTLYGIPSRFASEQKPPHPVWQTSDTSKMNCAALYFVECAAPEDWRHRLVD